MKTTLDRLIHRPVTAMEKITELEDVSIATFKIEIQRGNKNKTASKSYETITKDVPYT